MESVASWLEPLAQVLGEPAWLRVDLLAKLVLATVLGGAVGFEREHSGKPAGLRTNILICVGATLLTDLSIEFASLTVSELVRADPARIAAQIVSGIGFLGAGTIIQARGSVTGLTTAATLWVVAAIGMAVGGGAYVEATGSTLLVLFTLVLLGRLEATIVEQRVRRTVILALRGSPGTVDELLDALEELGLGATCTEVEKDASPGQWSVELEIRGPEERFREARSLLLRRDEVRGLRLG